MVLSKRDRFTKTGSGQTRREALKQKRRFSRVGAADGGARDLRAAGAVGAKD